MPEKYGHDTKDDYPAEDQSARPFCFSRWNLRISLRGHVQGLWTHSGCTTLVISDRHRYWRKGSFMSTRMGSRLDVSRLPFVLVLDSLRTEYWIRSIAVLRLLRIAPRLREVGRARSAPPTRYAGAIRTWRSTPTLHHSAWPDSGTRHAATCDHPAIIPSANRGKTGKGARLGSGCVSVEFRPPVASSQSAI